MPVSHSVPPRVTNPGPPESPWQVREGAAAIVSLRSSTVTIVARPSRLCAGIESSRPVAPKPTILTGPPTKPGSTGS
jgi:hypothetical protein